MKRRFLAVLAFGVIMLGSMVAFSGSAHAISGPCWFTSLGGPVGATSGCSEAGLGDYGTNDVFSGRTDATDYSSFHHVNTKTEFINYIVGCFQRNATAGYCTWGTGTSAVSDQNQIGAAFTISTMLSDPSRSGPHTWPTAAEVQRWVDLVSNSRTVVYTVNDSRVGDTSWYDNDKKNDFFSDHPRVQRDLVKVRYDSNNNGVPDKDWAALERECGNMLAGFDEGAPNFAPIVDLTASGNMTAVKPGDTPVVSFDLTNSGTADSKTGTLQVMYPGASLVDNNLWGQNGMTGGGTRDGLQPVGVAPIPAGPSWRWTTAVIPAPTVPVNTPVVTMGSLSFTIAAGAPIGNFNMEVYWVPSGGTAADVLHKTVTFRVVSVRTPVIYGSNSDTHAGSCATGYGNVVGSGSSVGEYVVSAAGMISGVASSNGSNLLNIGGYTNLCRADLYPAAWAGLSASSQVVAGSSFDVTGKTGVWYYNAPGGTLNISGTVTGLLTIVSNSNVRVVSPLGLTNAPIGNPHAVPSLGIIANGDIYIAPGATQVDAYMFANGTIFTCEGAATGAGGACNSTLTVHGFLMGGAIQLGRLGDVGTTGAPTSEYVSMNPNIYLNPPRYFDASIDNILLEGQGERAPLY